MSNRLFLSFQSLFPPANFQHWEIRHKKDCRALIGSRWSLAHPRANGETPLFMHGSCAAIKPQQWGMRGKVVFQKKHRSALCVTYPPLLCGVLSSGNIWDRRGQFDSGRSLRSRLLNPQAQVRTEDALHALPSGWGWLMIWQAPLKKSASH